MENTLIIRDAILDVVWTIVIVVAIVIVIVVIIGEVVVIVVVVVTDPAVIVIAVVRKVVIAVAVVIASVVIAVVMIDNMPMLKLVAGPCATVIIRWEYSRAIGANKSGVKPPAGLFWVWGLPMLWV